MAFQADPQRISWQLHLASPPARVYEFLATNEGRARFWAESAQETDGVVAWRWPNGMTGHGRILERHPPRRFVVEYLGGSIVTFELRDDGEGGTDLTLADAGVADEWRDETIAGWVSVLMALKAAADFSVDLRNHDPQRTWDEGFVDN
jgi:uncharacterized protein YndB with AHSA1/START domain